MKIRNGIFETNSSSSHTICLSGNSGWATDAEIANTLKSHSKTINGKLYITLDATNSEYDFGSDFSILDSWYEKMVYALAIYNRYVEDLYLVVKAVKKRITECHGIDFNVYREFECAGSTDKDFPLAKSCSDCWTNGLYINVDHQSNDLFDDFYEAYRRNHPQASITEMIEYIIFNHDVKIITASDSEDITYTILSNGFINDNFAKYVLIAYDSKRKDRNGYTIYKHKFISADSYMKKAIPRNDGNSGYYYGNMQSISHLKKDVTIEDEVKPNGKKI